MNEGKKGPANIKKRCTREIGRERKKPFPDPVNRNNWESHHRENLGATSSSERNGSGRKNKKN